MMPVKQELPSHLDILDFCVEMGLEIPGGEAFTLLGVKTTEDIDKLCLHYDRKPK